MFFNFKSVACCLVGVFMLSLLKSTEAQLDLSKIGILQIVGEKQYFVEKAVKVNWHKALQSCAKMNMRLASIESSTEQQNIKSLLNSNSALSKQYWISGNDLSSSRDFVWFGTGESFSYTSWGSGPGGSTSQRCVRTDANFNWRRDACSSLQYFICERPLVPACGSSTTCNVKPTIIL
ncbi:hypothetical protein FF38_00760 [Lucilia cuprina]|uniref:C-type lectin domain-containing protein n=1 Tax=Lucilia cuprina TaxID=7375 RepID=A0A0L0BW18_LUCCU|nr:Lectin subunit alpha [Lucilia cuprina]KNC23409.1 hypothetical protein FF38_00760 [Lucilia cuprina]